MSNPFAAVISDLRWIISNHETADFAPIVDIEAAIRVLEAAGKVDKERAIAMLGNMTVNLHDKWGLRVKGHIRALLAALPDEVKE